MKYLGMLLLIISFVSCVTDEESTEIPKIEENIFGASYSIIESLEYPLIRNDSLFVRLGYSGCGGGHKFFLRNNEFSMNVSEVFLYKETNQVCDAYFQENRKFELIVEMKNSDKIILIGPHNFRVTIRK